MGLLPGDVVDAISDGLDPVAGMHTDYFSVTRGSVGMIGTGVNAQSTVMDTPPGLTPGHAGDLFVAGGGLPFGANLLAPWGFGWTLGTTTGDEANAGLMTPTFPPVAGDNVNAYDLAPILMPMPVLFSLAPGSPTLLGLGAGPADILGVGGPYGPVPVIVIPALALGLPLVADIDALAAFGVPLVIGPGVLEYSLTAATAPLVPATLGSGATILGWAPPGLPITVHTPAALGLLLGMDDIDALDVGMPVPGCWDGIDNDGDFLADFPADPDCASTLDPTEARDSDGDGVPDAADSDDDNDGILTLGNAECTLAGWAGTTPAACCTGPGAGICATDNCPWTANATQADIGGIGAAAPPDGIGNACQCGDINNDGRVTGTDGSNFTRATLGLPPYGSVAAMPGFSKCNVNLPDYGLCTGVDANNITRATLGLLPGVFQRCAAALP